MIPLSKIQKVYSEIYIIKNYSRNQILEFIGKNDNCLQSEVYGSFFMAKVSFYNNLKILVNAGYVKATGVGREKRLSLVPEKIKAINEYLDLYDKIDEKKKENL